MKLLHVAMPSIPLVAMASLPARSGSSSSPSFKTMTTNPVVRDLAGGLALYRDVLGFTSNRRFPSRHRSCSCGWSGERPDFLNDLR